MKIRYSGWLLLFLCLFLVSCGTVTDSPDGILIIPGAAVSDSAASAAVTETQTTPETAAEAVTAELSSDLAGDTGMPELERALAAQVSELLLDEVFLSQLEKYGADRESAAAYLAAFLAYQQLREEEGGAAGTAAVGDGTVFWTAGGSVWHTTADCSALANAKDIRSGTEAQALDMGKSRVCKRCGGS